MTTDPLPVHDATRDHLLIDPAQVSAEFTAIYRAVLLSRLQLLSRIHLNNTALKEQLS